MISDYLFVSTVLCGFFNSSNAVLPRWSIFGNYKSYSRFPQGVSSIWCRETGTLGYRTLCLGGLSKTELVSGRAVEKIFNHRCRRFTQMLPAEAFIKSEAPFICVHLGMPPSNICG
jgi:hypothetical protein